MISLRRICFLLVVKNEQGRRNHNSVRPPCSYHFFFFGPLGLEVGLRSTPLRKCVSSNLSKKTNNPNPSPIGKRFGLYGFGARGGSRTRTPLRALAPEASESTNSTTRASCVSEPFRSAQALYYHNRFWLSIVFSRFFPRGRPRRRGPPFLWNGPIFAAASPMSDRSPCPFRRAGQGAVFYS